MNKQLKIVFIVLFLLIIYIFGFMYIIKPPREFSTIENRNLTQRPELNAKDILSGEYMKNFESYITDQVIFRDKFVNISTNIKLKLGQKDINNVIIHKNRLYNKLEGLSPEKEAEIDRALSYIEKFINNNPDTIMSIIPTSTEIDNIIYPNRLNQKDFIDKFYKISQNTIDIYSVLDTHKDEYIYYNTDHHWTTLGAFYAYELIGQQLNIETLSKDAFTQEIVSENFLGTIQSKLNLSIKPDTITIWKTPNENYERILNEDGTIFHSIYDLDKLSSKEQYAVFFGGNNGIIRLKNKSFNGNKKLVMIKDSYAHSLVPFLLNHYSEIILLDLRYTGAMGVQSFIDMETPDNIIILYNVDTLIEHNKYLLYLNR